MWWLVQGLFILLIIVTLIFDTYSEGKVFRLFRRRSVFHLFDDFKRDYARLRDQLSGIISESTEVGDSINKDIECLQAQAKDIEDLKIAMAEFLSRM